jgi:hypothetical protein
MRRKLKKKIQQKVNAYKLKKTNVKVVNVWCNKTKNIGDLVCSPSLYFQEYQVTPSPLI